MLTWAGMHGGVSIALALTLPFNEYRGTLLVVCYAVVVLSMLVQALTMPMVIRWLYSRGLETRDSAVVAATKPVEPA